MRRPVEDLDEYEEEDGEQDVEVGGGDYEEEEEDYEEEEEDPKPTKEELEYLELRQKLKEAVRKQMKKESGSGQTSSQEKLKKLPYDNYGSFFGPSQPVIAQRVIQESKSILETQHLQSRVSNSPNVAKKNPVSTPQSNPKVHIKAPKNDVKTKVQKLKDTRDYSFLLSDDAAIPAPRKEPPPPRNNPVPKPDARSAQVPIKSRQSFSSNAIRQVSNGRDERKPVLKNGQMQPKAAPSKLNSTSKHALPSMDSRKQLGSNKANGPGWPIVGPKGLPSKMPVANVEKRASSTQGVKDSMRGVHRVVSQSSVPKQPLPQKQEYQKQESKNGKLMPKPTVSASRPQVNKVVKQSTSHATSQVHRPQKKPVKRRYSDDEADDEDTNAISMIRQMFGYNPNKYRGMDEEDDDCMEANFDDILREERKSARIAREEDERELRMIEEEERRERMRKEAKKRKLTQR